MSLLSVVAHLSMSQTLSRADMSLLLPFDFVRLVFATAIGALLIKDRLDWFTLLGGSITLAASAASFLRNDHGDSIS